MKLKDESNKGIGLRVNIGCGRTPTKGWLNFDNSPALKIARSPFKYSFTKLLGLLNSTQIDNIEWNKENFIQFADATKSIPLTSSSVNCIYTSHMFEHLSREGATNFLLESLRVLEDGGVLRISVPDLSKAIDKYISHKDGDKFMKGILVTAPPINTLRQKLNVLISGYRHHQWMYDGESLSTLMTESGFKNVIIQNLGSTIIENATGLDLYERSEQSLYVEGQK